MGLYELTACNPATESENRIHADDVARRYGFAGGLVPGVTVYAYACAPIVEDFGAEWVERGTGRLRFIAPCYDGECLTVKVGEDGAIEAGVADRLCASGSAAMGQGSVGSGVIPWAKRPQERPQASEETFSPGRVLGTIRLPTDADSIGQYLETISEPWSFYRVRGWVHPGMLLNGANWILVANVVMPAWIHVESDVRHHRAALIGEPVQVRARVADEFERKGHRFVVADVDWVAGAGAEASEVVASARHTAIWRLAGEG
jgi:acyl dehydratase